MNPPANAPTDRAKYREQYLSNLALQASNDQKNLNANLIFKQTGATPSQPTDYRTTTEKASDIEGLRKEVRSFIASAGFTNSTNANEIAQMLHPDELSFVVQYKLLISTDFKGRGVPAEVFIAYLRKLKRKTDQVQGVEFGLQQETGEAILMSNQQIVNLLPDEQTFHALQMGMTAIRQSGNRNSQEIQRLLERIEFELGEMRSALPTPADLASMNQLPPNALADIQRLLNDALREVPTKAELSAELQELYQALQNSDERRTAQVLRGLQDSLDMNSASLAELAQIKVLVAQAIMEMKQEKAEVEGRPSSPPPHAEARVVPPHSGRKKNLTALTERFDEVLPLEDFTHATHSAEKAYLIHQLENGKLTGVSKNKINSCKQSEDNTGSKFDIFKYYHEFISQNQRHPPQGGEQKEGGKGLKGCGLAKPKRVRNYATAGKIEGEMVKPKPYIPFGRFVINKPKLNQDILQIRRISGGALKDMPTQRVSKGVAHILKSVCGGVIPHIDHITGLGAKDQEHLYKILNNAHIDNVPVPTPKTDDAKAIDRFDILKGEILAGNDNKTLVREFKVLLMKLVQSGRIPRREAHEVLTDLTALGF
jgi:hypothetical protein